MEKGCIHFGGRINSFLLNGSSRKRHADSKFNVVIKCKESFR